MTLYISDIDKKHNINENLKTGIIYLVSAVVCALFGAIYECFSHGVYSYFMIYAFALPLVGGGLPFTIFAFKGYDSPKRISKNLYASGIATLTVGCMFQGVLEIYGTTNRLIAVYWAVGGIMSACGILSHIAFLCRKNVNQNICNDKNDNRRT